MGSHVRNYYLKNHSRKEAKGIIEEIMKDTVNEYGPEVYLGPNSIGDKIHKKTGERGEESYISPPLVRGLLDEMVDEEKVERAFRLREHYRREPVKVPLYRLKK
ncbi:MAG: hypothetical protein KAT37_02010 [Candidatus Aenigmarchaeota archaeon]|nr:hypothetical protein [Candidatus Aenigmarchaeota archaeon]